MILVDSTVWIDYFNGVQTHHTDLLDTLLGIEPVAINDLIYTEVLQGFRDDRVFHYAQELFDTLFYYSMSGKELALKSAQNYRFLRKKGITVRKTIDVIIGTFCIENNLVLLHDDKDFKPMERYLGLKVL